MNAPGHPPFRPSTISQYRPQRMTQNDLAYPNYGMNQASTNFLTNQGPYAYSSSLPPASIAPSLLDQRNMLPVQGQHSNYTPYPGQINSQYEFAFRSNLPLTPDSISPTTTSLNDGFDGPFPAEDTIVHGLQSSLPPTAGGVSNQSYQNLQQGDPQPTISTPFPSSSGHQARPSNKRKIQQKDEDSSDDEKVKQDQDQEKKPTKIRRQVVRETKKKELQFHNTKQIELVLDSKSQPITFNIEGSLLVAGKTRWSMEYDRLEIWKRNTFLVSNCSFSIHSAAAATNDTLFLQSQGSTPRSISGFALKISAHTLENDDVGEDVGLIRELNAKRGDKSPPRPCTLAPVSDPRDKSSNNWISFTEITKSTSCQWERVSFKKATRHNGPRRSEQNYSCLCLSLLAHVAKPGSPHEEEEIVVARRQTDGYIVWARSPAGLKENENDVPTSGPKKYKSKKSTRTNSSNIAVKIERESSTETLFSTDDSVNPSQAPRRSARLQSKSGPDRPYVESSTETLSSYSTCASSRTLSSSSTPAPRSDDTSLLLGQQDDLLQDLGPFPLNSNEHESNDDDWTELLGPEMLGDSESFFHNHSQSSQSG